MFNDQYSMPIEKGEKKRMKRFSILHFQFSIPILPILNPFYILQSSASLRETNTSFPLCENPAHPKLIPNKSAVL